jgi:hypothetical protein
VPYITVTCCLPALLQLVAANRLMEADGDAATLTNVVFMGMGEPLHNLPAVLAACEAMCCPLGLHMSHNKVTVSTVGLAPEIRQFMQVGREVGQCTAVTCRGLFQPPLCPLAPACLTAGAGPPQGMASRTQ